MSLLIFRRASRLVAMTAMVVLLVGCSLRVDLTGGRGTCWPDSERRAASLWRGVLRVDTSGGRLETPEGEVIPLIAGTLRPRVGDDGVGQLVRGDEVVARDGDDVTLFGGAGSDGALKVCSVEELHGMAAVKVERPTWSDER